MTIKYRYPTSQRISPKKLQGFKENAFHLAAEIFRLCKIFDQSSESQRNGIIESLNAFVTDLSNLVYDNPSLRKKFPSLEKLVTTASWKIASDPQTKKVLEKMGITMQF